MPHHLSASIFLLQNEEVTQLRWVVLRLVAYGVWEMIWICLSGSPTFLVTVWRNDSKMILLVDLDDERRASRVKVLQATGYNVDLRRDYVAAERLDDEGIMPKRGKRWIHTTVKSILARNAA